MTVSGESAVELYWLPLGAGGHVVKHTGRLFEMVFACREHRTARPLYHSALRVTTGIRTFAIEMAPVWNNSAARRGVVATGPVGSTWLGHSRAFRYEVRCWQSGQIPDVAEAVDSPQVLSDDSAAASRILAKVVSVPRFTWGRDELGVGDMWNSNSLTSWLLMVGGIDLMNVKPPDGGRAPGWQAGIALAERQQHHQPH
ncbi:hypothetical protein ACVWY6_004683 [Williamsia sp. R60]